LIRRRCILLRFPILQQADLPERLQVPAKPAPPAGLARAALAGVERLKELGAGLMKELYLWEGILWKGKEPPIPYDDLYLYIAGIRKASTGINEAREAMESALRQPKQP
jgi:hypothetical protein